MNEGDPRRSHPEHGNPGKGISIFIKEPYSLAKFVINSFSENSDKPFEVTVPLLHRRFSDFFLSSVRSDLIIDNLHQNRVRLRLEGFINNKTIYFSKEDFFQFWKEIEKLGYKIQFSRNINVEKFFTSHEAFLVEYIDQFCERDLELLISTEELQTFRNMLVSGDQNIQAEQIISYLFSVLPDFSSILEDSLTLTISDGNETMELRLPTKLFEKNLSRHLNETPQMESLHRRYSMQTTFSFGDHVVTPNRFSDPQLISFSQLSENILKTMQKIKSDSRREVLELDLQTNASESTALREDYIVRWQKRHSDKVMAWLENLANSQTEKDEDLKETLPADDPLDGLDPLKWLESLANNQAEKKAAAEPAAPETEPEPEPEPVIIPKKEGVTFEDIIGQEKAVKQCRILVDIINKEHLYKRWGVSIPRGILLVGPPGTGKTSLAKAIANEAEAEFVYLDSSKVLSKWFGMTEQNIAQFFDTAEEIALQGKKVVLFMDDLDGMTPERTSNEGNETTSRITTYLLTRLDGFRSRPGVVFLAATNHKDLIDSAMIRSGRIDTIVELEKPSQEGIYNLLLHYLEKIKERAEEPDQVFDPTINFGILALEAFEAEFTGADIESFLQQAVREKIFELSQKNQDWSPVTLTDLLSSFRTFRR